MCHILHCHLSQGNKKARLIKKKSCLYLSHVPCILVLKVASSEPNTRALEKDLELSVTADMEIKMSSKPDVKQQIHIKETLCRTKNLVHKAYRNLKSLVQRGYHKLPRSTKSSIFLGSSKIQELDELYSSFSDRWESNNSMEFVKKEENHLLPRDQMREDASSVCNAPVCSGLEGLKEEKQSRKYLGSKRVESDVLAADALARKMKELEMMDVHDMDHVLDVEEALHYYSRLTCPAYQELVDKFFMDMYSELDHTSEPPRSVNSSMRKLGSASLHSSMRSLGPLKL